MGEIRCAECGRRYQSKSGLRRHMKADHGTKPAAPAVVEKAEDGVSPDVETEASIDTAFDTGSALLRTAQDARALPRGGAAKVVERALRVLGIRQEDMMAFRIYDDHVVIIEGPVGYKRVYAFPGAGEVEE